MREPPGQAPAPSGWQGWAPEAALAATALTIGLIESRQPAYGTDFVPPVLVALGIAGAVLCVRRAPGAALALVWVVGALQLVTGTPVLTVEIAVAAVGFGCARWGHPATVVASGLSIPVATAIVGLLVVSGSYGFFQGISLFREVINSAYRFSDTLLVGATILGMLVLALPWLTGLLIRATVRARRSKLSQVAAEANAAVAQRDAAQAQEIGRLRDEQTRLARDVHDVVGHSLAVILAQAESAQYLPDDPAQLKSTLATIATSARGSLQDVRQVLSVTDQRTTTAPHRTHGFESLVEGVRASGQEVLVEEVGTPQPLPPDLEVVAHRVLQEMLTNAVKHGARDHTIRIEWHWPAADVAGFDHDLRLEVSNAEPASPGDADTQPMVSDFTGGPGQGLVGMRRRLESVGGRIDVRRRERPDCTTFTATAWIPVRSS